MSSFRHLIGITAISAVLSACGGGGSSGDSGGQTPPPTTPTYTVATSVTGSGSGSLSPTSRTVSQGSSTTFTISASTGSTLAGVSGCGGTLSGTTYTTGAINGACTVTATFDVNVYTVTATASAGGSISPSSRAVTHGQTTTFNVTPNSGQEIQSVSGCAGTLSGNTYTTGPITAACSVAATFGTVTPPPPPPPTTFIVSTVTAGDGSGTVSPSSATVQQGQTATFTIASSAGSQINSVSGCGGTLSGNIYTTGPINAACTVTASFGLVPTPPETFTVSTAVSGNGTGSITPGSATVSSGETASFEISADTGSTLTSVSGCGGSLAGTTYTAAPITAACTVSASFSLNTYEVTATAGIGGGISPSLAMVEHGSTTSFTLTPDTGYSILDVSGCGGSLQGSIYTTGPITTACTVSADFSPTIYDVTAAAGTGGAISPGSTTVEHGSTTTFTVTTDTGYSILEVTGCGGALAGQVYTTGPITSACTVSASFSLNTYEVTASASLGGSITPSSVIVEHGSTATFSISTEEGFSLAQVSGCEGALDGQTYATGPITSSCSVSANFNLNTYEVTATAGPGGSISPSLTTVDHSQSASFTVTPDTGYRIESVTGCGGHLIGTTYTTAAITERCAVHGTFLVIPDPEPDTAAPLLLDFEILETILTVDAGDATPRYRISTRDEISGLNRMQVHIVSPSGNQRNSLQRSFADAPLEFDGTLTGPAMGVNSEVGDWEVDFVFIEDLAGNDVFIHGATLRDLGYSTTVQVVSSLPDSTFPTLQFFDILTNNIDVSSGNAYPTYRVELEDDVSGLASIQIHLVSPDAGHRNAVVLNLNGQLEFSGDIQGPAFSEFADHGQWRIDFVYLRDVSGNELFIQGPQLAARGFRSDLTVTGSSEDVSPPELIYFSIETPQVSVSAGDGRPLYSIEIADDLSGLESIQIHIVSVTGQRNTVVARFVEGTLSAFQDVEGSLFATTAERGIWSINFIFLEDTAGNRIFIYREGLAIRGFPYELEVTE